MNLNLNTVLYMLFDLCIIVIVGVLVYFKVIGNDLLLIAIGAVVRGGFGGIPTAQTLAANTAATTANTAAMQVQGKVP